MADFEITQKFLWTSRGEIRHRLQIRLLILSKFKWINWFQFPLIKSSENLWFSDNFWGMDVLVQLTLSWPRPISYINQSIDLRSKSGFYMISASVMKGLNLFDMRSDIWRLTFRFSLFLDDNEELRERAKISRFSYVEIADEDVSMDHY